MTAPLRAKWQVLPAAATFAVSLVFSVDAQVGRMDPPAALGVSAVAAGAVWLSGRRPAAAILVVTALTLALPLVRSTFPVMDLVVVVVAFQAVLNADLPPWLVALVCLVLLTVVDAWQRLAGDRGFLEPSVLYPLVLTGLVMGLGLQSRQIRRQHDELVALRDTDRRQAVSDERRRIARDLHDIAAHHLSVLIVHTRLATRLGTHEALGDAARFTTATASEALAGLRGAVEVLGSDSARADNAPLAPTPQLGDLDRIVASLDQVGLRVQCQLPPSDAGAPPVDVAVAAVRIAREALTNVLRHRGPGRAWLQVVRGDGVLTVLIEDDGPGTWRPEAADQGWHVPGHYGLVGMRERARACGGYLDIDPSARGGWRVSAVLPIR